MHKFRFTNKAVEDLTTIWDYTFDNWSESQADIYYLLLIENCKEIANNSEVGKNYTGISKNLKGLRAGRHIIFYRKIEENDVEIIRILHEQMDLKHRIREK
jgi:toxin ParE1/3/4